MSGQPEDETGDGMASRPTQHTLIPHEPSEELDEQGKLHDEPEPEPEVVVSLPRRDPLQAAERALAAAAAARGVPLELPDLTPRDPSKPFAAAHKALEAARKARGEVVAAPADSAPSKASSRVARDPFKAAEEALRQAEALRESLGAAPGQTEREASARRELNRLRGLPPSSADPSDDDDGQPKPRKRDL